MYVANRAVFHPGMSVVETLAGVNMGLSVVVTCVVFSVVVMFVVIEGGWLCRNVFFAGDHGSLKLDRRRVCGV